MAHDSSGVTAQDRVTARLHSIAHLSDAERLALQRLVVTVREVAPGQDIVREGERTGESCIVIEGFLQRYKMLPSGGRQILAFHVPGDIPDLQSLHLPQMDHSLAAVTPSRVALVAHEQLHRLIGEHSSLATALWREALTDSARFREWIANLGGRQAYARVAHLFCELYVRNRAVGLGEPDGFTMPLTQSQIGEALGMSVVHVSRMMVALKRDGLIALTGRHMRILDWDRLKAAGEFDPAYLHLREG